MNRKLSNAMKTAIVQLARDEYPSATPLTWRALRNLGFIELRGDGTRLSKLTPEGKAKAAELRES